MTGSSEVVNGATQKVLKRNFSAKNPRDKNLYYVKNPKLPKSLNYKKSYSFRKYENKEIRRFSSGRGGHHKS